MNLLVGLLRRIPSVLVSQSHSARGVSDYTLPDRIWLSYEAAAFCYLMGLIKYFCEKHFEFPSETYTLGSAS